MKSWSSITSKPQFTVGVTLFEFQCPLQFILRFIRSSVTIGLTASAYRIIHQISVICLQMIVMFTLRLAAAVKQIWFSSVRCRRPCNLFNALTFQWNEHFLILLRCFPEFFGHNWPCTFVTPIWIWPWVPSAIRRYKMPQTSRQDMTIFVRMFWTEGPPPFIRTPSKTTRRN